MDLHSLHQLRSVPTTSLSQRSNENRLLLAMLKSLLEVISEEKSTKQNFRNALKGFSSLEVINN